MKVFNTDMEIITFFFIVCEFLLLLFHLLFYYQHSTAYKRKHFLTLLILFIVYNICGGLFPDKSLNVNLALQYILAYGSGFAVACYYPYFLYKTYKLEAIRFHAYFGVLGFLLVPFILFLVIEHILTNNVERAIEHSLLVPSLYAVVVMFFIFRAIRLKFKEDGREIRELVLTYISLVPWIALPPLSYFRVSQAVEVSVMNIGFLITAFVFFITDLNDQKQLTSQLQNLMVKPDELLEDKEAIFKRKCDDFGFSPREIEVVNLIIQGLKYKEIAAILFISERTVTKHVQNIFLKAGTSSKFDLIKEFS